MGDYRARRSDMKLLLIAVLFAAGPALAEDPVARAARNAANATERTVDRAVKATERGAKRAAGGIERGAKATDKALTNAAKKTDNWVREKTR